MANGDGDQSKRPPLSQHDSDSQVSDKGQHGGQHHRQKTAKHHVGGRIHARVASSKSLHKGHGSTASAKLARRQPSPSPDHAFAFPPAAPLSHAGGHRRATSDLNLSREASATNLVLKKNSSHTSLKRNKSKVEVLGKKSKSSTNLKSHTAAALLHHHHKHGKAVNQVHFNLGDEEDDEDNPDDEWVDASTSASPLLSRRTSVVSGGQQSVASSAGNSRTPTASEPPQRPPSPPPQDTSSTNGNNNSSPRASSTSQHNQYLTSRILERTPAQGAPPMMSTETASARPTSSSRAPSPDSDAAPSPRIRPGSSGNKAELTSRFITTNSAASSGPGGASGPDSSFTGALARAANGRIGLNAAEVRRPRSMGNLAARGGAPGEEVHYPLRQNGRARGAAAAEEENDDDDAAAGTGAGADRKTAAGYVMNRTQQKIDLQRASSSLEPSIPPHHPALSSMGVVGVGTGVVGMSGGPAAGQVVYGRGGETVLPRLLERTGMEYLCVRRYQNPIARSLARLAQVPGHDRKLRIPKQRGTPAHSRQGSELRDGRVQSLRDREGGGIGGGGGGHRGDVAGLGLIGGRGERSRPGSRRGGYGVVNGDGADGEQSTGLSGSSLVDGGEDATTLAVLRNLWDKNMDLSASQE